PTPTATRSMRRGWRGWLLLLLLLVLLLAGLWALWHWRGPLLHRLNPTPVGNFACTPGTPPPDFLMVLDTSGSMNLNVAASAEDETWFNEIGGNLPSSNPRRQRILAEPTRLSLAKQAMATTLKQVHPAVDTRLLTFGGCHWVRNQGLFSNAQRPQLLAAIDQLSADRGTPLAYSLEQAAEQVDGRMKDAVVVMFVDGEDTCDQDACAVAERIAREQPRLRVNMVSISENPLSQCIATATGGRVYAAREAQALGAGLREAMEEVAEQPDCAP
ncbi:VWA domain-containing protein, partial [Pseudomonas sp.]|uniref:VWA domain-containing protein n=1 Tax=Pseudomonas sp. TaxID=306 RepID=UPI0028A9EABA